MPTTNPVPSSNPSDLLFNAQKLDEVVNGTAITYTDRLGVTRDTVAGAVYKIAGITNRGAWASATAYATKDIVLQGGVWYVCVVAHTSAASFATDSASKWRVYQGITLGDLAAASGAGLAGFSHSSTYAAGTVGAKLKHIVNVMDAPYSATGDGVTDDSAAIDAAVAAAAGGVLYIPAGTFIASTIQPAANTVVMLHPGAIVSAKASSASLWRLMASNVHIVGNGAKSYISGVNQTEHNVRIEGNIENISVDNLWLDGTGIGGAGVGDDCVYIGGTPASNIAPRDVRITNCKMTRANRNCVSVVCVDGLLIDGCDISGATGQAPKAGIDIEANAFNANGTSAVRKVTIRKSKIHDNGGSAISVVWGSEVTIDDCDIYDNAAGGVNISPLGTDFAFVPTSLDTATGWITLTAGGAGNKLCDDYGVYVGMQVFLGGSTNWSTKNASLTNARYTVVDIDSTQSKIRVGQAVGLSETTSFLATTTTGLSVSFYGGLCVGDVKLLRSRVFGNTGGEQVTVGPAVDVELRSNKITAVGSEAAISGEYTYGLKIIDNTLIGEPGGGGGAIVTTGCQGLVTDKNNARLFDGYGIYVERTSGFALGKDAFADCGSGLASTAGVVTVFTGTDGVVSTIVRNSDARPSPKGIYLRAGSTTNIVVRDAVARTAGADNATSIETNNMNRVVNSIVFDGTFYGDGSATWDPPSLAAGAQQTTTVSVPGALVGDQVSVMFSQDTAGTKMTGQCLATGVATIAHHNPTTGAVNLPSGILRVRTSR